MLIVKYHDGGDALVIGNSIVIVIAHRYKYTIETAARHQDRPEIRPIVK